MSPPSDNETNSRKRVCKACDRCRLKKSKCDGSSPCNRCRSDNAICVFGERKKSHDKIYPKGYVEMLEQQQTQLVNALQELYRRLVDCEGWKGEPLETASNGHPLTHDILERLDALRIDGHLSPDRFEESTEVLQQKLLADGAVHMKRQLSPDSDSCEDYGLLRQRASSPKRILTDTCLPSTSQFPPTPPIQTPSTFISDSPTTYSSSESLLPESMQLHMPQQQLWAPPSVAFPSSMDFFPPGIYGPSGQLPGQGNPCLPIPEWLEDDGIGNLSYSNNLERRYRGSV